MSVCDLFMELSVHGVSALFGRDDEVVGTEDCVDHDGSGKI